MCKKTYWVFSLVCFASKTIYVYVDRKCNDTKLAPFLEETGRLASHMLKKILTFLTLENLFLCDQLL